MSPARNDRPGSALGTLDVLISERKFDMPNRYTPGHP